MSFWEIIAWPFGKILWLCYLLVKNYGLALLLFAVIIKLIMLPSSIKQQMSTARMARLSPKLEQIKKKYANNKDKINEATMELYNQENVNPMGSCLPLVLTFVILFAVIEVVYAPLSYIGGISKDKLTDAQNTVYDLYVVSSEIAGHETTVDAILENGDASLYDTLLTYKSGEGSRISEYTDERLEEVAAQLEQNPGLDEYMTNTEKVSSRLLSGGANSRTQLIVISVARDYPALFDSEVVQACDDLDYTFLGVYLGEYPSWSSILILIPIVSLVSQLALTFISQYFQKKSGMNSNVNASMKVMLYVMPLISFWIAFSFPAGIGIYWIFSSVVSLAQTVALNIWFTPERTEKILAKQDKKGRKKPSLYQMALEKQKEQLMGQKSAGELALEEATAEEVKLSRAEKKEAERAALNESRRRYYEKYGDTLDSQEPDADASDEESEALKAARLRYYEKYGDNPNLRSNGTASGAETTEKDDSKEDSQKKEQ